jgi:hypothetical protein
MSELITLFLAFICVTGTCEATTITITREALAIASCESGDGHNYGTIDWTARSSTNDGGAFQFNDNTALWLVGRDHVERWSPIEQYRAFTLLWDNGHGWRHWTASQPCWSQWLEIHNNRAVWYNYIE